MRLVRFCLAVAAAVAIASPTSADVPPLIPLPVEVSWHDGRIPITSGTSVIARGRAAATGTYITQVLGLAGATGGGSRIRLSLVKSSKIANPEAYTLRASGREIVIEASDPRGLFYGAQSLRQLITTDKTGARSVRQVDISDSPRFRWRGLLIDVSRHFFGKKTMISIIDEMALYKLNVLQLHLTDDPGWRLEIPGYPKLTDVGALDATTGKREYFSVADMREIIAYADDRHIMVVPEIEMPGHSGSEARSYPEFFDNGGRYNPGNPATYGFVSGVLGEVAKIFPAPYLHFGGDEVDTNAWEDLPEVARLKAEHGLKTNHDVQSYFGHRVADIITGLGKRPMAWDEQAEAGAAKNVIIFWWRKGRPDVLNAAARAGYDIVMAPVDQVYFDYPQGPGEPGAPWEGNDNGPTSISKILAWEPVPNNFTPEQASHVIGLEAAVWTEFIKSEKYLQFMTFPRMLAYAEVAWRPRGKRDEAEFDKRLGPHIDALRARGIYARREQWDAVDFMTN